MRVGIVLLGLAVAPFTAGAAQDGAAAVKDPAQCAVADAHRSPVSYSHDQNTDPQGRERTGCSPVAPPSQPPPPPPAGSSSISGTIWSQSGAGLSGWVVDIAGPVNASTVSDASGAYSFTGIPAGTYTVCEEVQTGWSQTSPTMQAGCPSGMGYDFGVPAGGTAAYVDFTNRAL